jgi:hypothetical protein
MVYRLATQAEATKNELALYGNAALSSIQGSGKSNLLDEVMVPTAWVWLNHVSEGQWATHAASATSTTYPAYSDSRAFGSYWFM